MIERPYRIPPPRRAGPARRVIHTLLSLGGWVLFVWWWWIVVHRVSPDEMRFTGIFVALALVVTVLVTLAWVWHNLGIFERRGPRTTAITATSDFSTDGVGRPVTYATGSLDRHTAPVVHVLLVEHDEKRYEAATALPSPVRVVEGKAKAPPTAKEAS